MTTSLTLLDDIMAVMEAAFDPAFGEAWNRRQVSDALAVPSTRALLIDQAGTLLGSRELDAGAYAACGFTLSRAAADEEELLLIAVLPDCRRRGLGHVLLKHLLEAARARGTRRMFLEMRWGNPAARLYQTAGFKPIGRRAGYYHFADGRRADAITFAISL